jgi:hypothetical protein
MTETNPAIQEAARAARLQYLAQTSDRLSATMGSADRFVNFAGIIAAATITGGIIGHKPLIVILAPYALAIIFTYQLQLFTDAERFTVLLNYLESQLNSDLRTLLFRTGSVFDRQYRNRWSVKGVQIAYSVALSVSFTISGIKAYQNYGLGWLLIDIAGLAAIAAVLGVALREISSAKELVMAKLTTVGDQGAPPVVAPTSQGSP